MTKTSCPVCLSVWSDTLDSILANHHICPSCSPRPVVIPEDVALMNYLNAMPNRRVGKALEAYCRSEEGISFRDGVRAAMVSEIFP